MGDCARYGGKGGVGCLNNKLSGDLSTVPDFDDL